MHEVLVNRLEGLSLPRKSVDRLTDRPHMTLDVYRGRKTTQQQPIPNQPLLHGPPRLVDKTNYGLVLCNHANFYRFEDASSDWSVKRISVFLCFSSVKQRHTSGITVYNRTVTNIRTLCGPSIAAIADLSFFPYLSMNYTANSG